jgi:hypothetical protein
VALLVIWALAPARAHDIPSDVTVQAFLKPEGRRLRLLVRAPLQAMRDIVYPTRGNGLIDFNGAEPALHEAVVTWIARDVHLFEGERPLGEPRIAAVRLSMPSDQSFREYDTALAHFDAPRLDNRTDLDWTQGLLDVLLEFPIDSDQSVLSIEPRWGRLGISTLTVLRYLPAGGGVRPFEFHGDPGLIRLDPRWHQAAGRFVRLGFEHILGGVDHLLFLLCLVIPFRRLGPLVGVVTAFTVAHSITLLASAYDLAPGALWFPALIETLIAASIVYMAIETCVAPSTQHRWALAFGFGLVHGFGFSFVLRETLQFAGDHLLLSLLSFNLGVELGQLLVLLVLVPALVLLFRRVPERAGTLVLALFIGHTAWHWMVERGDALTQYTFAWPELSLAVLLSAVRWLTLIVVVGGAAWLLFNVLPMFAAGRPTPGEGLGRGTTSSKPETHP